MTYSMTHKARLTRVKGLPARAVMLVVLIALVFPITPGLLRAESIIEEAEGNETQEITLIIGQTTPDGDSEEAKNDLGDISDKELSETETIPGISDPLQPWNRMWHHFNDKAYFWMFKPMAQGYRVVIPEGFRISFGNFYTNATAPVRIFNSLFQLKFHYFFTEFGRFLINTTMGFAGMRDCAKDCFGIRPHDEDFGQTLGHYGIGHGIYLVWPLLGPSSARDTIGKGADSILSFTGILSPIDLEVMVWAGLKTHEIVNDVSFRIGDYEKVKEASIDPYIAIRDGYRQRRQKAVRE